MTDSASADGGHDAGLDGAVSRGFVTVCGLSLCLDGKPFVIHGASAYAEYNNVDNLIGLAKQGRINTIELVEFEADFHNLISATSEATWKTVDNVIARAGQNGIHVVLDLSSYGQSLQASGIKPTTFDWNPYLEFVTKRVNTESGVRYADDPTIAMVELFGEIDAPNGAVATRGTTQETTDFFHRTLAQYKALDAKHVLATGGFSYLDWNSGIDWQTIMSDPHNDVCALEINAVSDRNVTMPMVTSFCKGMGKPWFLAAWSSCFGVPGSDNYTSDEALAAHAQDMYNIQSNMNAAAPGPAYAAIGSDFWNLGFNSTAPTCDLGPFFPLVWQVVQRSAP